MDELKESSNGESVKEVAKILIDSSDVFRMVEGILEEEIQQTTDNVDELFVKIYNGEKLSKQEKHTLFKFNINVISYLGNEQEMKFYIVYLKKLFKMI